MHGERDSVIPVRFGKALYAAIKTVKEAVWFPDGEHHNLVSFGTGQRALDFLARLQ